MDRTRKAARNIYWGFINKVITSLLPFLSRTVVLYVLGTLYLGIGSLFSSVLGMLSLAELGFNAAIVYSMYKPMAEGDTERICALLKFYRQCYRIIGCVILLIGLLLLPFLKYMIRGDYPEDISIYAVYLLYLLNTVVSYLLFAYKRSLLQADQRNDVESKIASVTCILRYGLQIIVLLVFRNYYLFVFVMVGATILDNILVSRMTERLYPEYVCRGSLEKCDYGELKKQLKGLIYRKIGDVVLFSVDNIVISSFLGLEMVAMYGNYYSIVTFLFSMIGIVSSSLKAGVGNAVALESKEHMFRTFKALNLLYVLMAAFVSICFLCLVQPVMRLWVGDELMFGTDMVLLFSMYIFSFKWCDMLYVYQEAYGIWWNTRFIPILAAAVNLIVNILLVNLIGVEGILISTIVSILFVYDLGYACILFRVCFKGQGTVKDYIVRQMYYLCVTVFAAAVCVGLCRLGPQEGFLCLLYRGIVSSVGGGLVLLLGVCRLPEFSGALAYISHMAGRGKERA